MHLKKALTSVQTYFHGAFSEMKKVVWPTKKQTTHYSIAVIVMSIFVAIFFGMLDYFFSGVLTTLINL
jgi:preprotein translocase SecE subunit